MTQDTPSGTVLAFDFGFARIGVAVGESLLGQARGLTVVGHREDGPDWRRIEELTREWSPALILVGRPLSMDGGDNEMTTAARQFADELAERCGRRVELIDERLSSVEAASNLREERRSGLRKKRVAKGQVDQEAARLLIEQWFSGGPRQY